MLPMQEPPLPPPLPVPAPVVNAAPVVSNLVVGRTRATFALSEAADVTLTVEECLRVRRKPCGAFAPVRGEIAHAGRRGTNAVAVPRRVGGRRLAPGRYRLSVSATDAAGARSGTVRAVFVIG